MPLEYDIGDVIRLRGTFTDTGGAYADPTKVSFWVKAPSSTVYVAATPSTTVLHPSTGVYTADYLPVSTGLYRYRIFSTGNVQAAEEGSFRVATPLVASTA